MVIEKELDLLIAQFAHVRRHFMVVLCVPHPYQMALDFVGQVPYGSVVI